MPLPRSDRKRIRELFLEPRGSYGVAEVCALLQVPESTVQRAIDDLTVAASDAGGEARIGWEDVVALGLEHRWTVRMLSEALRGREAAALPPLVRVAAREVVLPRYQWEVLRLLAERRTREERREITVSDLLEEAVSEALLGRIEDWESLEAALPGVREATAWPGDGE